MSRGRGPRRERPGRPRQPGGPPSRAGARDGEQRLVVGLHPVRELLRANRTVRRVLVAVNREPSPVLDEIVELARRAGVPVDEVERGRIDERAEGRTHQGILALAPPFPYVGLPELLRRLDGQDEPALLVALDAVTDPHNLGSIARTAEAVGAHALLLPERRAAGVTPSAEKAAAGALAHLPVVRVPNLVRALRELHTAGIWSLGLDGDADTEVDDSQLLTEPLVLVVGAEGRGLARLTAESCDQLLRLPMRGAVGSLNASVAAAVSLYAVHRARRRG